MLTKHRSLQFVTPLLLRSFSCSRLLASTSFTLPIDTIFSTSSTLRLIPRAVSTLARSSSSSSVFTLRRSVSLVSLRLPLVQASERSALSSS